jgi:hypothetical protein
MVYFDTFFVVVKTTRDVAVCGTNPESKANSQTPASSRSNFDADKQTGLLMPTIAAMFSQD